MTLSITPLTADNRTAWETLWQESVGGVMTQNVIDHTYMQLTDQSIHAFIAKDGDNLVGLLHYVVHPVAGCVHPVCYMQDLYVSPNSRRKGVARALIDQLKKEAEARQFDRIYWLLENGNEDAKEFYKDLAISLDFGLYMIPIKMKDRLNLPQQ
jgi:ribosomal protein S18 acetylase RimI-like enzyme